MNDNIRQFYEQVGERYPEDSVTYSSISGLLRRRWILNKMLEFKPGNLLDCGCNTGRLSGNWRHGSVYGIDISFAVLLRGKAIFPSTQFIHADLRHLDFIKSGSIDNVLVCEVVEHIDKPMPLIEQFYRIMKRGAKMLITVPGYTKKAPTLISIGIMRSYGVRTGTAGDRYLHTAYRPHELADLIKSAGFQIVEQGSFERELRLWQKPINAIESMCNFVAVRFFPSSNLNILCNRSFERLKLNFYNILDVLGIISVIRNRVQQGRRTFVLAEK